MWWRKPQGSQVSPARVTVLYVPDWPIVAARADESWQLDDNHPVAISAHGVIAHCSPEARAQGVFVGQRVRDAQVGCPQLAVLASQPEREWRLWNQVLSGLHDTVAQVFVIEPGVIAMKSSGLARYYGSEQRAGTQLLRGLQAETSRVSARVATADTLFAATVATRYAATDSAPVCAVAPGGDADFLGPLPLSVLDSPRLVSTLTQLGFTQLADFAALDPLHVQERFGLEAALLHSCARGVDPRTTSPSDIPASTDRRWRGDTPLARSDALSFALRSTVEDFLRGLVASHVVCTNVSITLVDDRGATHSQVWSHPRFFDAADLVNRVRWQWESIARESPEEYQEGGIQEVTFQARSPERLFGHEPGLWGGGDTDARVEHAIAQVQSRLGHQSVGHAVLHPGHSFEEREQIIAWGTTDSGDYYTTESGQERPEAFVAELPKPLPATVFQPPQPVALHNQWGDPLSLDAESSTLGGLPSQMLSGGKMRQVVAWAGPWPVLERWWDPAHSRCRYRLQLLDQQGVGWLVSQEQPGGHWQIEARYD